MAIRWGKLKRSTPGCKAKIHGRLQGMTSSIRSGFMVTSSARVAKVVRFGTVVKKSLRWRTMCRSQVSTHPFSHLARGLPLLLTRYSQRFQQAGRRKTSTTSVSGPPSRSQALTSSHSTLETTRPRWRLRNKLKRSPKCSTRTIRRGRARSFV